ARPSARTTLSEKRVGVFTSTRADFAGLGPVVDALARDGHAVTVIAGGTHRSARHGSTVDDLHLPPDVDLELLAVGASDGSTAAIVEATSVLLAALGDVLPRLRLDCLVILGDRWELLPVCSAALLLQIPLVHLHGGELTEGALDERVRHAVTK